MMHSAPSSRRAGILSTKLLVPPLRALLVPRARLIRLLDSAVTENRALVLVSAPPGFGKSTLLTAWAGQNSTPGWVSLDAGDNDPIRFLTYLVVALESVVQEPAPLTELLELIRAPGSVPPESLLTLLLNALQASAQLPVVLILDDYHVIDSTAIHELIALLVERRSSQLTLILSSRADPPLPLARWRTRGELLEVRADDLRFTPDEAAEFLSRVMGVTLTAAQIAALEARTEGWIAGLQLAALSMRGHHDVAGFVSAFTGSHHFIVDYLVEEVLQRQPETIQHFLLETSILERLEGKLCDAVTGGHEGRKMLEQLERANLFVIPLDDARQWYRYHHLFAGVLRARLEQAQSDRVPELHRRASAWFDENGFVTDAVGHALAASDFERAAMIIQDKAESLLKQGEHVTLRAWLERLPAQVVRTYPRLSLYRASIYLMIPQLDAVEKCLDDAERDAANNPSVPGASIRSEVAAIRARVALFQNDVHRARILGEQALEEIPADNLRLRADVLSCLGGAYALGGELSKGGRAYAESARFAEAAGDLHTALYATFNQATVLNVQGQFRDAKAMLQRGLELGEANKVARMPIIGLFHRDLAELYYQWNNLELASRHAQEALTLGERGALPRVLVVTYIPLARILNAQGNPTAALEALATANQLVQKYDLPSRYATMVKTCQVWLWLTVGNVPAAAEWVQAAGIGVEDELNSLRESEQIALARVLMAQGEFQKAEQSLERLCRAAEVEGRMSDVLIIMAAQVVALQGGQSSPTRAARSLLEQALVLAEPEGYIRTFVDEGEPMRWLLSDCRTQLQLRLRTTSAKELRRLVTYTEKLLAAFVHSPAVRSQPLIEPLTTRELEVLHLLAQDLPNPEIARKLVISTETVKVHLKHIYGKLEVKTRYQAVLRARALDLL